MVKDKAVLVCLLGMNVALGVLLCFTVIRLVGLNEEYQDQLVENADLKEEIRDVEQVEKEIMAAIKYELESQEQRNSNIEIEYMKILNENKENASPTELMFLNYLMKVYGVE